MKTTNTECKYCNQAYMNCYQTCPKSPARSDDVVPRVELDAMRGAANSYKMHYENVKSEVALDLLSELKKDIHNKAVFPGTQDVHPYISLKVLDGIIQNYINRYYEEGKGYETT